MLLLTRLCRIIIIESVYFERERVEWKCRIEQKAQVRAGILLNIKESGETPTRMMFSRIPQNI